MAQVKKLQAGGTPNKKLMYNGVEFDENDINAAKNATIDWFKNNTSAKNISSAEQQVNLFTDALKKGSTPTFKENGVELEGYGKFTSNAPEKNIFGHFSNTSEIPTVVSNVMKQAMDQISESKKSKNVTGDAGIDKSKWFINPMNIIAKNDYNNNFDTAMDTWSDSTRFNRDQRKDKIRTAIIESINASNNDELKAKIPLLSNKNISDDELFKIGDKMGYNLSEMIGAKPRDPNTPVENPLTKSGYTMESNPIFEKMNVVGGRKDGKLYLFNKDEGYTPFTGEPQSPVILNRGKYYGYGLFKNSNNEWAFDTKENILKNPEFGKIAEPIYTKLSNISTEALNNLNKNGKFSVDFSNERSDVFGTSQFMPYREGNKFNFMDFTSSFSGIPSISRLIIPTKGVVKDDIFGAPDITKSKAFLSINGNMTPVSIVIDDNNKAFAVTQSGEKHDLGYYGDQEMNTRNANNFNYKWRTSLNLDKNYKTGQPLSETLNLVAGSPNIINNLNVDKYISNILSNKFSTSEITPNEAKQIADSLVYYYNTLRKGKYDAKTVNLIENKIKELNSGTGMVIRKNGGVLKAQMGALLTAASQSEKVKTLPKNSAIKQSIAEKKSGETRLKNIGTDDSFAETADVASTILDGISLIGGPAGIIAGLAATGVQLAGDVSRGDTSNTLKNLGMNLGFTALSFIPGLSATKFAKSATKAAKLIDEGKDVLKVAGKLAKTGKEEKLVETALKGIDEAKNLVKDKNFVETVLNNKLLKAGVSTARIGLIGTGATEGLKSGTNIYNEYNKSNDFGNVKLSDVRGLLAGFGALKGMKGYADEAIIKKGTTRVQKPNEPVEEIENPSLLDKSKAFIKGKKDAAVNKVDEKINPWDNRVLKQVDDKSNWFDKYAINKAQEAGFTPEGYGIDKQDLLRTLYSNNPLQFGKSIKTSSSDINKVRNYFNELRKNLTFKNVSSFEKTNPVENNMKVGDESWEIPFFKSGGKMKYLQVGSKILNLKNKDVNPGEEYEWKSDIVSGIDNGSWVKKQETKEKIYKGKELPEVKITQTNVNTNTEQPKYNINIPKWSQPEKSFDPRYLTEASKYISALNTNAKTRAIMSRTSPALLQMPTEIYRPVVTNLANEQTVKNQVNNMMTNVRKPLTSDATKQKLYELEALNKGAQHLIEAKAANTDMYNKTLDESRASAEKYALNRNEIANKNIQAIVADAAMKDRLEAGQAIANNASFNNFIDKLTGLTNENIQYKNAEKSASSLRNLQTEFTNKLKPISDKIKLISSDYTKSNTGIAFNEYKKANGLAQWESSIGRNDGKTWKQAYEEELNNLNTQYNTKYDQEIPFFKTAQEKLSFKNPNKIYFKSGGSLTNEQKIEIENIKGKVKKSIVDSKNEQVTLDRKQKEVARILDGLSKESFFLLKTMLGK